MMTKDAALSHIRVCSLVRLALTVGLHAHSHKYFWITIFTRSTLDTYRTYIIMSPVIPKPKTKSGNMLSGLALIFYNEKGLSDSSSGAIFRETYFNEGLKFGIFSYFIYRYKC